MSMRIFVSHSFKHSDKLLRIQEFIRQRGIEHVDYSVPAWDQLNDDNVQSEIKERIRTCDRVILILTKGTHKSSWIMQEVAWAREFCKPVIGVWPHGEAGSPIPKAVIETNAHLIGWRSTSLEKALTLQDVGDYRALVLAEDADFDQAVRRIVAAGGAIGLLLVGYDVLQLGRLRRALRLRGFDVDMGDWRAVVGSTAKGAGIGALLGWLFGAIFGRTPGLRRSLTLWGALTGGAFALHRRLRAEIKQVGSLTLLQLEPANEPKMLGPAQDS